MGTAHPPLLLFHPEEGQIERTLEYIDWENPYKTIRRSRRGLCAARGQQKRDTPSRYRVYVNGIAPRYY